MDIISKIIVLLFIFLVVVLPFMVMWWVIRRVYAWTNARWQKSLHPVRKMTPIDYYEVTVCFVFLGIAILTSYYAHFLWAWPAGIISFENDFITSASQCGLQYQAIERINIWHNSILISSLGIVFMSFGSRFRIREMQEGMALLKHGKTALYLPVFYVFVMLVMVFGISTGFDAESFCDEQFYRISDAIFFSIITWGMALLIFLFLIWGTAYYVHNFNKK